MNTTALILAGGRGERFWPKSRKNLPKQFLSLTGDGKTMIQLTVERISHLVKPEDIFIITNRDYKNLVQRQLPDIPECNIICEPIGRNTAPCIGLGAIHISLKYKDALMFVLPSDHQIKFEHMFLNTLKEASTLAQKGRNLVTIGILPDYPETGYGYIKFNPNETDGQAYKVERFVEKPKLEVAKDYLETGEYLWNSGMFIWKVSSILYNIEKFMPQTFHGLNQIQQALGSDMAGHALESIFPTLESQSIDYGIMEKASDIYILPGTFGWDDVGSWLSIDRLQKTNEFGNIVNGNVITVNTCNCIIQGSPKLIAAIGLENIIVVDTEDAILICEKDSTGDIKKVLENLKVCNRDEYL